MATGASNCSPFQKFVKGAKLQTCFVSSPATSLALGGVNHRQTTKGGPSCEGPPVVSFASKLAC